jgi:hypothetical protein
MKNQALQYYMHDGPTAFRFELAGHLNQAGALRLEQDWRTASSVIGDRKLIVDITFVTGIDERGTALLTRWHRQGALLIANSKASRTFAESILGESILEPPVNAGGAVASHRTWLPFHSSFLTPTVNLLMLFAALLFPVETNAATLKSDTVAAWDDYVRTATENLQDRARPGGAFLWTFEDAQRAAKVRNGEIVVAPVTSQTPKKLPGGLIHHWIGAVFLPNLKLDDTLEITRDYDDYKDFYRPTVVDSKVVTRSDSKDEFSMVLMNKALFLKQALDADYQASNVRLDDRRFYSVCKTTRVQEIDEYGQPGEHRSPEGEGRGYIWKLFSIARLEQRDGGVYVELEAIALSREIPVAVRFVADPIVRRVSRNSLLISLQQTGEAARGSTAAQASVGGSSNAEHLHGVSASRSNRNSGFTAIH